MNKKTILIIAGIITTIFLLIFTINTIIDIKIKQLKSSGVDKESVVELSNYNQNISSEDLKTLPAQEREIILNKVVSSEENISNITGLSSTTENNIIISNGIIAGVTTGTPVVSSEKNQETKVINISSGGDLQQEIQSILEQKNNQ